MLVFMTYNVSGLSYVCLLSEIVIPAQAYLILAVVLGAGIGHFVFGSHMDLNAALSGPVDAKGMACH